MGNAIPVRMEEDAEAVPWWVVIGIVVFGLVVVGVLAALLFETGSLLSTGMPWGA